MQLSRKQKYIVFGIAIWIALAIAPDVIRNLILCVGIGTGAICLYMLPWIVARVRNHHNRVPILLVNLFFGLTGIGWGLALIWAFTNPPPRTT